MKGCDDGHEPYPNKESKESSSFTFPEHNVAVYTVLYILLLMRKRLGIEAMLEYVEEYLIVVEQSNPRFQTAVRQALALMSVEKMYKDALNGRK